MKDIDKLVDQVQDRESFMEFVRALIADREDKVKKDTKNPSTPYGSGANGWENSSIESYLDASLACMQDSIGGKCELAEKPSWNSFARFLYNGKTYE